MAHMHVMAIPLLPPTPYSLMRYIAKWYWFCIYVFLSELRLSLFFHLCHLWRQHLTLSRLRLHQPKFIFYTMCWWRIFQELEFSTSLRCGALHRAVFYIRVGLPGKGWGSGEYFMFIKSEKEIEPRRKHC